MAPVEMIRGILQTTIALAIMDMWALIVTPKTNVLPRTLALVKVFAPWTTSSIQCVNVLPDSWDQSATKETALLFSLKATTLNRQMSTLQLRWNPFSKN